MKCTICKRAIEETFLGKIKGTYIKKEKKKYSVCRGCQIQKKTMAEILANLP